MIVGCCRWPQREERSAELDFGDIILADRYHCNYFTAALLMARGVDLVTRQHQRRINDFRRGRRLGQRDHLVECLSRMVLQHAPKDQSVRVKSHRNCRRTAYIWTWFDFNHSHTARS